MIRTVIQRVPPNLLDRLDKLYPENIPKTVKMRKLVDKLDEILYGTKIK